MELKEAMAYVADPKPYDEARYLEAGLTLVRNRDKMTHRVFYKIPDPGAMTTNLDPKWDEIKAGSTGERCSCGNCRTIWPLHWPEFEEKEEIALGDGEAVYIVPEQGNFGDTLVEIAVASRDDKLYLFVANDPFSDALNFRTLLSGPPGFELAKIGEAMRKQKEFAYLRNRFPENAGVDVQEMTIVSIKRVTKKGVVIGIGKGYAASRDPKTEFPKQH